MIQIGGLYYNKFVKNYMFVTHKVKIRKVQFYIYYYLDDPDTALVMNTEMQKWVLEDIEKNNGKVN